MMMHKHFLLLLYVSSMHHECVWGLQSLFQPSSSTNKVALVTGATGRTGQLVTKLLVEDGFRVRVLARDPVKAKQVLPNADILEFCKGDLGDVTAIQEAFQPTTTRQQPRITHVVYCAGGDGADYNAVSYRGVAECAKCAARSGTVEHFVFISTAWATKPYSIASLLFNSLYDTIPMACHYMGEQEIRRQAKVAGFNYVILRPGGLNSDENYQKKYPEAATDLRLTYQQGDTFEFLGPAGRPGMCRTQLANAVAAAVDVQGPYTVEVTGSGNVDMKEPSIYQTKLVQDDAIAGQGPSNAEIMRIHSQAVGLLKNTAIAASVGAVLLIAIFGWIQGIFSLLALDALIIAIWSLFLANQKI